MPASVQQILEPRAVLEPIGTAATEDELYGPQLSHDRSAILLEREPVRLAFNFRALARHLGEMNACGGLRGRHNGHSVILEAKQLEDVMGGADAPARQAAQQCLRILPG